MLSIVKIATLLDIHSSSRPNFRLYSSMYQSIECV